MQKRLRLGSKEDSGVLLYEPGVWVQSPVGCGRVTNSDSSPRGRSGAEERALKELACELRKMKGGPQRTEKGEQLRCMREGKLGRPLLAGPVAEKQRGKGAGPRRKKGNGAGRRKLGCQGKKARGRPATQLPG